MSGGIDIDLRYPIGGLFVTLGLILVGYGVFTRGRVDMYLRSNGVNVNVWWGIAMLVFGALMLWLAVRADRRAGVSPAA